MITSNKNTKFDLNQLPAFYLLKVGAFESEKDALRLLSVFVNNPKQNIVWVANWKVGEAPQRLKSFFEMQSNIHLIEWSACKSYIAEIKDRAAGKIGALIFEEAEAKLVNEINSISNDYGFTLQETYGPLITLQEVEDYVTGTELEHVTMEAKKEVFEVEEALTYSFRNFAELLMKNIQLLFSPFQFARN